MASRALAARLAQMQGPRLRQPRRSVVFDRFVAPSRASFGQTDRHETPRAPFEGPSTRPQVRRGYPLSLSISISGGKETYKDSPSNGERTGKCPG